MTSLISNPLISLDYIKNFIEVRSGYTGFDTLLTDFIAVATKQIETATCRSFTKQARTEIVDSKQSYSYGYDLGGVSETGLAQGVKEQIITLKGLPIDSGSAVELRYDVDRLFTSENVIIPTNKYYVDYDKGQIHLAYPTIKKKKSIKVTYTAGYEPSGSPLTLNDSIPYDLKQACVYQTMFLWNNRILENVNSNEDRSDGASGSSQKIRHGGLTPEVFGLIAPYYVVKMAN